MTADSGAVNPVPTVDITADSGAVNAVPIRLRRKLNPRTLQTDYGFTVKVDESAFVAHVNSANTAPTQPCSIPRSIASPCHLRRAERGVYFL
jgi:hypothetical protein